MKKSVVIGLVLVCLIMALTVTVMAQEDYPVELAGVTILRVRFPASGFDASERMHIAYERLIDALGYYDLNLEPELVNIRIQSNSPAIFIGDKLFFTVDEDHAVYNGAAPMVLAEKWAANLRLAIEKYLDTGLGN
ncbi:MAG: hypothetical protein ACOYD6_03545 [Limnochordia bacterium]